MSGRKRLLVQLRARVCCDSDQAKLLVSRIRNVSYGDGEARIESRHRVEGNTPIEAARKEAMVLEHSGRIAGVEPSDWLEIDVSAERLVWDGERWRLQGEPVV